MRVLYIAQYNDGSTSGMRGEYLKQILGGSEFKVINTDVPMAQTQRLFKSVGWRFKTGPFISNINNYILKSLNGDFEFDLVWIDKGVFIKPLVVELIRKKSKKLVHFTPDPAFTYHRSRLFYEALPFYDICVTTKSFEIKDYETYGVKTIFCTQGFDPKLHKPYHNTIEKDGVVFIGHREEDREEVIAKLIEGGIRVIVAGNHWEKLARRYSNRNNLVYRGKGIYGDEYAKTISSAKIGLGFLSKWIPELHTTRSFEIPACGTALVTESTTETRDIYETNEVIFFDRPDQVPDLVQYYLAHNEELNMLAENGHRKVVGGGYSYFEIMEKLVSKINPIQVAVGG